jgi:hypothetical protein
VIDFSLVRTLLGTTADLYARFHDKRQAARSALRLLHTEVVHNLAVLECLQLGGEDGPPVSDAGYLIASRALRTEAHVAVLLSDGIEDDLDRIQAEAEVQRERLESLRALRVTVEVEGIDHERPATEQDPDIAAIVRRLRDEKTVGLLEAASVVASRVQALQSLSELPAGTEHVRRKIRTAMRLRTIRAYEDAIFEELERQKVIPRARGE